jgi:hypothetical protein
MYICIYIHIYVCVRVTSISCSCQQVLLVWEGGTPEDVGTCLNMTKITAIPRGCQDDLLVTLAQVLERIRVRKKPHSRETAHGSAPFTSLLLTCTAYAVGEYQQVTKSLPPPHSVIIGASISSPVHTEACSHVAISEPDLKCCQRLRHNKYIYIYIYFSFVDIY